MGKTLYVSDLDGTLLQPGAYLSERTIELLNKAIREGVLFTIATARTPATVAPIVERLEMQLPGIVMTGAGLWNKQTNAYSNLHFMDPAAVRELVEIYRAQKCPTFLYTITGDKIHIYHIGPLSEIENNFIREREDCPYKCFHIPESGDSELPERIENAILFYGMQPDALSTATYAKTSCVANCRAMKYYDLYGPEIGIIEAFSPRSTKAEAIKAMAKELGVDRVVSFGDNLNDLPMLEISDIGVAVENAIDEVKAKADKQIGPNTDDSVAKFICQDSGVEI